MTSEEWLKEASDTLQPWTRESSWPEEGRLDIVIDREAVLPAVEALVAARWGYLASIMGLDHGPGEGRMECIYHFCRDAAVLGLRVEVGRDDPSVSSVCGPIPSASFFERELAEMYGITVEGTPVPDKLFLPDDWPEGVYPLRKDFDMTQLEDGQD